MKKFLATLAVLSVIVIAPASQVQAATFLHSRRRIFERTSLIEYEIFFARSENGAGFFVIMIKNF